MAKLENVNIEIDGVKYRKVDRAAWIGDVVRITDDDAGDCEYLTNGGFYEVEDVDWEGDPLVTDDDGDELDLTGWKYEVYEKVDTVKYVSERFQVGDYAKVITTDKINGSIVSKSIKVGDIFEIIHVDQSSTPYRGRRIGDGFEHWLKAERVVRATDEEVRQARSASKRIPVGSIVRITVDTEDLPKGAIAKVTHDDQDDFPYRCELLDGSDYDFYRADQIEVLSEEEAKWAVLGRKVNEYKNGDVVRATHGYNEIKTGDIGVVTHADGTELPGVTVRGVQRYVKVELVAPVESRVDIAGGGAK